MRSLNLWKLLLIFSTATACSTQPSPQSLGKELRTINSWAATAHMVSDSWLKGTVPNAYAKRTLQTTQDNLKKETDALEKIVPNENRDSALSQVENLQQIVSQVMTGIEQRDRDEVTRNLQDLSNQEQSIHTMLTQLGEQP